MSSTKPEPESPSIDRVQAAAVLLARSLFDKLDEHKAQMLLEHHPHFLCRSSLGRAASWKIGDILGINHSLSPEIRSHIFGTAVSIESGVPELQIYATREGIGDFVSFLNLSQIDHPLRNLKLRFSKCHGIRFAKRCRPVFGGASIGPDQSKTNGTMGAWLRDSSGKFLGISNNHVLAGVNKFGAGKKIIQPGGKHGGTKGRNVVGTLRHVEGLKRMGRAGILETNFVDVAYFTPKDLSLVDPSIGPDDASRILPSGEEDLTGIFYAAQGRVVVNIKMHGNISGWVTGTVTGFRATVRVQGFRKDDFYCFEDQIEASAIVD